MVDTLCVLATGPVVNVARHAREHGVSKSHTSRCLCRLHRMGMAERDTLSSVARYRITDKGRAAIDALHKASQHAAEVRSEMIELEDEYGTQRRRRAA